MPDVLLRPSPHLSLAEVACKDGTPYPPEWYSTRLVLLAAEFEAIRTACGNVPIVIGSAYRTPAWNAHVGGAVQSQHVEGRALDLYPPKGWTVAGLNWVVLSRANDRGVIGGVGLYATFVHMDIRPSLHRPERRLVLWTGTRARAEVPLNA